MAAARLSASRLQQLLSAEASSPSFASPKSAPAPRKKRRRKLSKKRQLLAAKAAEGVEKELAKSPKLGKATAAVAGADRQLEASKFRFLNEQLYTMSSSEAFAMFQADPEAFHVYHQGYLAQRQKWDSDPLRSVVRVCRRLPAKKVIADFGCGDARLQRQLGRRHTVHSFDLVALRPCVTACDMAHCPLADESVDVAVFCLSLMNSNVDDFLVEAARVLRRGGLLFIVEIRSRIERTQRFVNLVQRLGFQCCRRREDKYLVDLTFAKVKRRLPSEQARPHIQLRPCMYKKR